MRKKKTPKSELEKELNNLWKDTSRKVYPVKCLVCEGNLSTYHHFIPKSRSLALRYDIQNSIPICQICHYKIHFSSKPSEVYEIVQTIIKKRGDNWYKYIKQHEHDQVKRDMIWLNKQKEILDKIPIK
jgi:5-methylcytosine-specific restriction endonuclease McrA